jgi:hypothetical protein
MHNALCTSRIQTTNDTDGQTDGRRGLSDGGVTRLLNCRCWPDGGASRQVAERAVNLSLY